MKTMYRLLTELSSRKSISKMTGRLAKSKISKRWIPHFAKVYKIDVNEAEKNIDDYQSLNAFFTRRLKQGVRTIDARHNSVISPVDALITGMGKITNGMILNIKGQQYTIHEMLQDEQQEHTFSNGQYIVLYLSPTDYHRIHSPITGHIVDKVERKGKYYPVNEFGLVHMKRVLSRNQRVITYIQNEATEVAVVKVGALNVASIQFSDTLISSDVKKGDELAYFEFGSTVVLLFKEDTFQFKEQLKEGQRVKMGQSIGYLKER